MDIYRKIPIPAIYTQLDYVRASNLCILMDHPDDKPNLEKIQRVAAGDVCVSTLDGPVQLIIKASFPDDILERNGTTWDRIEWQYYCWKLWDAENLVVDHEPPAESVSLEEVGINQEFLDSLAHPTSCIDWLHTTQDAYDSGDYKGYELSNNTETKIKQYEKPLIARLKLNNMKRLKSK